MREVKRLLQIAEIVYNSGKVVNTKETNNFKTNLDILKGEPWTVVFAGQYNVGKTTLINALYGEKVFETGPVPTTKNFQEVMIADGLRVIDTEGFNAPEKEKDNKVSENKEGEVEIPYFHALVFVVDEENFEEDKTYNLLLSLNPKTPVFIVFNLKDGEYNEEEKREIRESILGKIKAKSNDIKVHDVFFINAKAAEKGILEGKPKLYEKSNIRRLKNTLRYKYMELKKGAVKNLFNSLFKILRPNISKDVKMATLYAETRVLFEIFYRNGESITLPLGSRLKREDFDSLIKMFHEKYIVEIKPALQDRAYTEIEYDEMPIIHNIKLFILNEHSFLTIAGLEIRNGEIRSKGGELFIINSKLYNTPLYFEDVSHNFVIKTDMEKASPALDIKNHSVVHVIESSFDSRATPWYKKTSDSVIYLENCTKDGKKPLRHWI